MIIVITGPTCTSKSKIAIEIANTFNAEIVNADAFQIYKELDIGTAKPEEEDLKQVRHHLYNFLKPTDRYSIYDYQKDARKCIDSILKSNKNVVLVGGSGLYIRAALYDYKFNENEKKIDLSAFYDLTNEELHAELKKVDPKEATKIHPNNRKRVLRALYIYFANNTPKSELEAMQEHKLVYKDVYIFAIDMDKKDIYERINLRVEQMISKGLIKEANDLAKKYGKDLQSFNAIGYREIINNPNLSTDEIKEMIQKDTRHYAKRQITFAKYQYGDDLKWIKNSKEIIDYIKDGDMNSRSKSLIGEENILKLNKIKVAIVGVGGVGGTAAEALIRSGVNNLALIDHDIVNVSNLNRQVLFTGKDIDKTKTKVAKRKLKKINENAEIEAFDEFLTPDNLDMFNFKKYDYVIDAIDSTKSKVALIQYLLKNKIKFISSLGMGNRLDLTKVKITTLDKTHDDPLAKKLREELKKEKAPLNKIKVVFSEEIPLKDKSTITSMIFVPSTAGLLLASYVINDVIKKEK